MQKLVINKHIEPKYSLEWLRAAFYAFREQPVQFIILSILGVTLNFLPLLGAFILPLLIARFALLTQKIENQEKIMFSSIFSQFFSNLTLVRLSFLNFTLTSIILIVQYVAEYIILKNYSNLSADLLHKTIILVSLIPLMILQMTMWISPIICLNFPEIKPSSAMMLSFKAGIYNVPTFLLYTLLLVVFTILAILPIGLGLIIWIPVLNISSYYIYKTAILHNPI